MSDTIDTENALKMCAKCGHVKSMEDFFKQSSSRDGRGSYCKDCMGEYQRERLDKEVGDEPSSLLANRLVVVTALMKGCSECGGDDIETLHFHHRDPGEKERSVSLLISGSTHRLVAEIKKCVVLCANCHSKRHGSTWKQQYKDSILLAQEIED